MGLHEIDGNLLDPELGFDAIAHGCNCFHAMGSGIAGQIRKQLPYAYEADKETERASFAKVGTMSVGVDPEGVGPLVFNLYTQFYPGPDFRYDALHKACVEMHTWLTKVDPNNKMKVGIPLIGAGIGGGYWPAIRAIIASTFHNRDLTIVHFKPEKNDDE